MIELMVVVALIGVLVALLMAALGKVRSLGERVRCANNLRQIGLACHHYHDLEGSFPPGFTADPHTVGPDVSTPGWGWAVYILPHLEQGNLYSSLDMTKPIEAPENAKAIQTRVPLLECPSDPNLPDHFPISDDTGAVICEAAPSSYAATFGIGDLFVDVPGDREGVFYPNSHVRLTDIIDGTSETVLIGDRSWTLAQGIWAGAVNKGILKAGVLNPFPGATAPAYNLPLAHNNWINIRTDPDGGLDDFASNHPGGVNVLFADGSVRFIADIVGAGPRHDAFMAMGTMRGSEVVDASDF